MKNPFQKRHGSDQLKQPKTIILLGVIMVILAFLTFKGGVGAGGAFIVLPFAIGFLSVLYLTPRVGLIIIYVLNFFVLGITRYLPLPLGLSIDIVFILIYLMLFLKSLQNDIPWENAKNDLFLLACVWYGYTLFQLVNPEAASRVAWFYAMRGVSLYMLFIIPAIFIIYNKRKDLEIFFKLWAVLSLIGTAKGLMQKIFGVDPWEQAWLDAGGNITHILFGQLRIFSFFTDAGQFGAAQGHAGVIFGILALNKNRKLQERLFYLGVAIMGFYGMMISGTRGAMAVPVAGFALYIILQKNTKVLVTGAIFGILVIGFFKFTNIGQGNYNIRRMRTAFNPNEDASMQVRLANQRKLSGYMASRPFGGGIGSAGNWGQRFSPNTFLANTPTDSWYVMVWAEQGVIGLILHLLILFYIVGKSSYLIMFKIKDDWLKTQMSALVAGMFGIMGASYGNGVLGQMPTGLIIYSSMAFLFLSSKYEEEMEEEKQKLLSEIKL